jgi:8-oxo-dGTP diphosphatase
MPRGVGLAPLTYRLMLSAEERFPERNGAALHHIYVVSGWDGGEAENLSDEHVRIGWFSLDEMAALPNLTVPDLIAVVREYVGTG